MTLETFPFHAASILDDAVSQNELINDALKTGEIAYIAHALGIVAWARGMSQVSRDAGVTREALYRSLSQDGDPRLSTLLGVLKALGLSLKAVATEPDGRAA